MRIEAALQTLRETCEAMGGRWPQRMDDFARGILLNLLRDRHGVPVEDQIVSLIQLSGGRIEMTHEEIANAIGAARETVTRVMQSGRFQHHGSPFQRGAYTFAHGGARGRV